MCAACSKHFSRWKATGNSKINFQIVNSRGVKHLSKAYVKKAKNSLGTSPVVNEIKAARLLIPPVEVILRIVLFLPSRDVYSLRYTCSYLKEVCQSDRVWKIIIERDFSIDVNSLSRGQPLTSFYTMYKMMVHSTKNVRSINQSLKAQLSQVNDSHFKTQTKLADTTCLLEARIRSEEKVQNTILQLRQVSSGENPVTGLQDEIFYNIAKKKKSPGAPME